MNFATAIGPRPFFLGPILGGGGAGSAFTPASLFTAGALGAWYDPSDLTTMSQDAAGTTPAAVDSPVGRMADKSGRGNHLTQTTAAQRPILRSAGAVYWLEFDGVDDSLNNNAVSFAQPWSYIFGVEFLTLAGTAHVQNPSNHMIIRSGSNLALNDGGGSNTAPVSTNTKYLMHARFDGASSSFDLNGGAPVTGPGLAAGTCTNLIIGTYAPGVAASNMKWYGFVAHSLLSGADETNTRAYIGGKMGS